MRIDIATLFPEMCERVLDESIVGRAHKNGLVTLCCHNIRDYTEDKQRRVDDTPYGGGMGMLMQAPPIYACYESVCRQTNSKPHVIYMSPQGTVLTQQKAIELSGREHLLLLCGHYEGVDERVLEEIVDEEISIGDYVLTGGELPALVLTDAVVRLCDGVLSDEACFTEESHFSGLLEYPQYTRPYEWKGKAVPEVLLSGHHANITRWRRKQALMRTRNKRPDMMERLAISKEDKKLLEEIDREEADGKGEGKMECQREIRWVDKGDEKGIKSIASLADTIWREHYGVILSQEQIDYMLEKFQSPSAMKRQMEEQGYRYGLILWGGRNAGYVGFSEKPDELFLSKLYVLEEYRGRGLSSFVFTFLQNHCKEQGLSRIWLTVNKHNKDSIAVYEKKGFSVFDVQTADIGNGFVMDDYLMELKVSP